VFRFYFLGDVLLVLKTDYELFSRYSYCHKSISIYTIIKPKRLINRIFSSILAVLFLIRLFHKSNFYAPKFIGSYYEPDSLAKLRRLERAVRTRAKRKADIEFLHKCLTYHLTPVFLCFKLYKKNFAEKSQCSIL